MKLINIKTYFSKKHKTLLNLKEQVQKTECLYNPPKKIALFNFDDESTYLKME